MTRISWLHEWLAFNAHQRSVDKLDRLSDRLLEDIGLRRDQLDALRLRTPEAQATRRVAIGRTAVRSSPRGFETSLKGCG